MKNVRIKVRESCSGFTFDYGIYEGKKSLMHNPIKCWGTSKVAARNAKAMAKRIGIKYDSEIIQQHGC